MFKNLIIYRIAPQWRMDWDAVDTALQPARFQECSPTQERSCGLVPARGQEHGALVESVAGQWVLCFVQESKILPASVLARKVQEKAAQIEQHTGRKLGKKHSRDLKDEAKLDLLPQAFTKQNRILLWLDPQAHWLVLDTPSQSRADEAVSLLTQWLPGFALALLDTHTAPQTAMARWLKEQEPPAGFTIDQECELKSSDTTKAVVRYTRHSLEIEQIRTHIEEGKLPTKLALTWNGRLSFLLTEGLQLKKLHFLEGVFTDTDLACDAQSSQGQGQESHFDSNVAITTGELGRLLPDLIEALDGEGRSAQNRPHARPHADPADPADPSSEDVPF